MPEQGREPDVESWYKDAKARASYIFSKLDDTGYDHRAITVSGQGEWPQRVLILHADREAEMPEVSFVDFVVRGDRINMDQRFDFTEDTYRKKEYLRSMDHKNGIIEHLPIGSLDPDEVPIGIFETVLLGEILNLAIPKINKLVEERARQN